MKILFILISIFFNFFTFGQNNKLKEVLFFDGYLKQLQTYNLTTDSVLNTYNALANLGFITENNVDLIGALTAISNGLVNSKADVLINNFYHNRLNFEFLPNDKITAALELRNQIFIGEYFKTIPNFAKNLDYDNGFLDLKFNVFENNFSVFNTQIDRFWFEFIEKKWSLKIGRQRINWAINLIWNPNDIFNAYNFLDFDYEERPGTDALKFTYYPNTKSSLEIVYQPNSIKDNTDLNNALLGAKHAFNFNNYDFQTIAAYNKNEITLGLGFAGNIKNGGLKAELTYFSPINEEFENDFNFTIGYDNITESGIFYQIGYLFNQNGFASDSLFGLINQFSIVGNNNLITAKNVFPYKNSFIVGANKSLNARTNLNFGAIVAPKPLSIILTPSLNYSIAQNWDFDLFVQTFLIKGNLDLLNPSVENKLNHFTTSSTLRIKFSF